ncbi:Palmitoyltransferase ZDHHC7 [Ooceraea biroi]|nr:Palmitoyltransferase ZDHHC7 [Ooceraea biroi]
MKFWLMIYTKIVPRAILLYAVIIIALTIYLNGKVSPVFVFLCVEMSLNWYCVYRISHKSSPLRGNSKKWDLKSIVIKPMGDSTAYKYWYCKKCQLYMRKPTQHCVFCKKCYHFREQHCFLLGACVLRQNMGNFILLCFYASLASVYTMLVMGWCVVESLDQMIKNADNINLFENFCFPITLIKLLSKNLSCIFIFILFNLQIVMQSLSMGYGFWKLYTCLTGKQCYGHLTGKQDLKDIFGSYSLMNVLFPYNGLVGKRSVNDGRQHQLKEV